MEGKTVNKIMLALWSLALFTDILSAASGNAPSWVLVFCPLSTLIMKHAIDAFFK